MKHLHHLLLLTLSLHALTGNAITFHTLGPQSECIIGGNKFRCEYPNDQTVELQIYEIGNPQMIIPSSISLKVYEDETVNGSQKFHLQTFTVTNLKRYPWGVIKNEEILKLVSLPETILSIDSGLFSWNSSLTEVYAPNVQSIGNRAFCICTSLTSISCPNVQSIGNEAFKGCTSLTNISCHNVQSIGNEAFEGCTSLTSISCPNVQSIGREAFELCVALRSVFCPKVQSILEGTFSNCWSLTSISLPNVKTIGATGLIHYNDTPIDFYFYQHEIAFYGCISLTSISLPNVQFIGDLTFGECYSLSSISCPKLQSIGEYAFVNCTSLESISIDNEEPPTAFYNTFENTTYKFKNTTYKTAQLNVPESAIEKYKNTWPWSWFYLTLQNYPYTDFYESQKRRDEEVNGVTADGRSELLIVEKDFPENVSLTDYSVVVKIDGEEVKDKKLIGEIGELKYLNKDEIGFVYTAPDGYAGPDNSSSYSMEIKLTPKDKQKQLSARVEVWRPGVLMLHGLNDNSFKCWNDGLNYLLNTGSYTQYQINNASYQSSNKASFHDNTYRYKIVEKNLKALYAQMKAAGIVSSRYDLVGHSMGGILSRKYAQEINDDAVNRILTFNTPHSGSPYGEVMKNAVDLIAISTAIKSPITALRLKVFADSQIPAVYDLGVNSAAIQTLNNPSKISNAYGIPVHAACSAFDGTDEKQIISNIKTAKPINTTLNLWINRMKNSTVKANLVLDLINEALQTEYHDGVVPLTSQRGGLTVGSTASLLTDKYPLKGSLGGFDSYAHHCMITHWNDNHERLISLLRAPKDDSRFAKSFAPVKLSYKSTRGVSPAQRIAEAKPESFIKITAIRADSDSRLVNISLKASDDVINKGAFCILDEDRVILSDLEDECTFSIPSDYEGKLEIIGLGYTSYDAWVTDGVELDFENSIKPSYIIIEGGFLALSEGESVEPQVTAYWSSEDSGSSMEKITVNASFELVDCEGEAEIVDGLVRGLREGTCSLVATYREVTDIIPVLVMKSSSGIEEIGMAEESVMKIFRRDNQIVVRMTDSYDGTFDFEVFDLDGRLITRNVAGGYFQANEDILFSLPNCKDSFMVVRCRREDGETVSMKILY